MKTYVCIYIYILEILKQEPMQRVCLPSEIASKVKLNLAYLGSAFRVDLRRHLRSQGPRIHILKLRDPHDAQIKYLLTAGLVSTRAIIVCILRLSSAVHDLILDNGIYTETSVVCLVCYLYCNHTLSA